MRNTLDIKKFSTDYLQQVFQIEQSCFNDCWSVSQLAETVNYPSYAFFVALVGNKAVGYVVCNNIDGDHYIEKLAVIKSMRQKGVGSALLNAVLNHANDKKANFVTLEVRESNISAIMLYEKFGFNIVGERPDFYEKPKENAIIMTIGGENI